MAGSQQEQKTRCRVGSPELFRIGPHPDDHVTSVLKVCVSITLDRLDIESSKSKLDVAACRTDI